MNAEEVKNMFHLIRIWFSCQLILLPYLLLQLCLTPDRRVQKFRQCHQQLISECRRKSDTCFWFNIFQLIYYPPDYFDKPSLYMVSMYNYIYIYGFHVQLKLCGFSSSLEAAVLKCSKRWVYEKSRKYQTISSKETF